VDDLAEQVERRLLPPGLVRRDQKILVAVSGGVDSMVLLDVLARVAKANRWKLAVAHLNHCLRGSSSNADERLVQRTAKKLKIGFFRERVDVRQLAAAEGWSVEMAARKARHEFLARAAGQYGARFVALAHHADDQVELFFLRLLRGTGPQGLSGMKPASPSPANRRVMLVRPFLTTPKSILRAYAKEHKVRFREDASNERLDFQRNRIRSELLPLLRRHYQPGLDRTVARVSEIIRGESEFVEEAARQWMEENVSGGDAVEGVVSPQPGPPHAHKSRPGHRISRSPSPQPSPQGEGAPGVLSFQSEIPGRNARTVAENSLPKGREARPNVARVGFEKLPVALQRRCLYLQLLDLGIEPDFALVEQLRLNPEKPWCVEAGQATVRNVAGRVVLSRGEGRGFGSETANERRQGKRRNTPHSKGWRQHGHAWKRAKPLECGAFRRLRTRTDPSAHRSSARTPGSSDSPYVVSNNELLEITSDGEVRFSQFQIKWRIGRHERRSQVLPRPGRELFDADKIGSSVILRHWRPGDRFQPIGMTSAIKLQDLFVNAKVPRPMRHQLVVAATGAGEIFWVEGLRIGERFKLQKSTKRVLHWRWQRG
jgi:tRNA(Ile)-lysidine synthetase-like protein